MKTLNYYKQLRESYACIIPKTAPAYELIEALDDLIASLQPKEDQPHFLGVPVNLPKGWTITYHNSTGEIALRDTESSTNGVAIITSKSTYAMWWNGQYYTTRETQQDAIEWLCDKANKS